MKHSLKKDLKKYKVKDYISSNESFNLFLDKQTDIVWTEVGRNHQHEKYYKSVNYIPHHKSKGLLGFIYTFSQRIMFSFKLFFLNKYLNQNSVVVDYGSGDGEFSGYLNKRGFNIIAYDPLTANNHLEVSDNQADMFMFWHVLEHLPDIDDVIFKTTKKLKKNGLVVIAVPNRNSLDAQIFNKHWAAWDVPRHLYHFNNKSLIKYMSKHNFRLLSKHPLILDSFYISYLSLKNKGSMFLWGPCLLIGFLSNFLALFTSNYSSSFYVFSKD